MNNLNKLYKYEVLDNGDIKAYYSSVLSTTIKKGTTDSEINKILYNTLLSYCKNLWSWEFDYKNTNIYDRPWGDLLKELEYEQ